MKKFETITEHKILKLAIYSLMEKREIEERRVLENPDRKISKHWLNTYDQQINEIHQRILELEKEI